jgi:hypothetical protein
MSDRPYLFIVVDAVPFDVAEEAWVRGALPGFPKPSRLLSTFPSLTHVAIPALLRGFRDERPGGYEPVWFAPDRGQILRDFDMLPPGGLRHWPPGIVGEVAMYSFPMGLSWGQARHFAYEAGAHPEQPLLAWVSATDAVAHFKGRAALLEAFLGVCRTVLETREEIARRFGTAPRVVLVSDHGTAFLEKKTYAWLGPDQLGRVLGLFGFQVGKGGEDGVALPCLGNVGGGVAYTHPRLAVPAAEAVAETHGVDLAFGRMPEGFTVFAVREDGSHRATIRWEDDPAPNERALLPGDRMRFRYDPEQGDPLGYADLAGRWMDDAAWFEATYDRHYPDVLRRVHDAVSELVQNPATVLFSMEPGWVYGPASVHRASLFMGGQNGTHGGITKDQTIGFAFDSSGPLPSYLRSWEPTFFLSGRLDPSLGVGTRIPRPAPDARKSFV